MPTVDLGKPERDDSASVTMDWARCCDCHDEPTKAAGTPCEVTLLAGETLRLRYESSLYAHNVFQVPDEDAFDKCLMDDASEVAGKEEGVTSLDISLHFQSPGTFFYVCARNCDSVNFYWCYCAAFAHKLRVRVLPNLNKSATFAFAPGPPNASLGVESAFDVGLNASKFAQEAPTPPAAAEVQLEVAFLEMPTHATARPTSFKNSATAASSAEIGLGMAAAAVVFMTLSAFLLRAVATRPSVSSVELLEAEKSTAKVERETAAKAAPPRDYDPAGCISDAVPWAVRSEVGGAPVKPDDKGFARRGKESYRRARAPPATQLAQPGEPMRPSPPPALAPPLPPREPPPRTLSRRAPMRPPSGGRHSRREPVVARRWWQSSGTTSSGWREWRIHVRGQAVTRLMMMGSLQCARGA